MTNHCVDVEQIEGLLALSDDDPRRRHLDQCPRCKPILTSYLAFLEADATAGADPAEAESRLAGYLETVTGHSPDRRTETVTGNDGFISKLTRALFLRPAWAAAALVVVAAGILWWSPWSQPQRVLRDAPQGVPGAGTALDLHTPQIQTGGVILLTWEPLEGADAYQVRLYGEDLAEIVRFHPTGAPSLSVDPSTLPGDTPAVVLWRVAALQGGDEISISEPAPLQFR
jgi:hypothetical protein